MPGILVHGTGFREEDGEAVHLFLLDREEPGVVLARLRGVVASGGFDLVLTGEVPEGRDFETLWFIESRGTGWCELHTDRAGSVQVGAAAGKRTSVWITPSTGNAAACETIDSW